MRHLFRLVIAALVVIQVMALARDAVPGYDGKPGTTLGQVCVNPMDGAEMAWVPDGPFPMGSADDDPLASADEKPRHTVDLDGFWIYRTPVTVAQYRRFCQATGRQMPPQPVLSTDAHPVVFVMWEDAATYARWACAALPTEAQWEKAARGTDGRIYPWGNAWDRAKCINSIGENAPEGVQPVGSCQAGASPCGALDMVGNVWQWCADWYDPHGYRQAPERNPTGPATGATRVIRGGSWRGRYSAGFRAAYRNADYSLYRINYFIGFRCVVNPPPGG